MWKYGGALVLGFAVVIGAGGGWFERGVAAGTETHKAEHRADRRFRTVLTLSVDGRLHTFSNVYRGVWSLVGGRSLQGFGAGRFAFEGEAMVIDLGERGTAYMLFGTAMNSGRGVAELYDSGFAYENAMLKTLQLKEGRYDHTPNMGSLDPEHIEIIRTAQGRFPYRSRHKDPDHDPHKPFILAFADRNDLQSVYHVPYDDFARAFGPGVEFVSLAIEFTHDPVTKGEVQKHLPWLDGSKDFLDLRRDEARASAPLYERPLWYFLRNTYFTGSWL